MRPDHDDGTSFRDTSPKHSPPHPDEVEITVLGKGFGESVVVHYGGKWVVIDSFFDQATSRPAALVYLESLGVKPAEDVASVVLTHMHQDHYSGIDITVSECRSAGFYLPGATSLDRWKRLKASASASGTYGGARNRDVLVWEAAETADGSSQRGLYAADMGHEIKTGSSAVLKCVGPTSAASLSRRLPTKRLSKIAKELKSKPNCTSIVLWLEVESIRVLLCADFEQRQHVGWEALMKEHRNSQWLTGASLVKVPHHGSEGAHHRPLYEQWCHSPIGIVTAYTRGPRPLPQFDMVEKLRHVCSELYQCSNSHRTGPPPPAAGAVCSNPNQISKRPESPTGRVTARRGLHNSTWAVTVGGPAKEL